MKRPLALFLVAMFGMCISCGFFSGKMPSFKDPEVALDNVALPSGFTIDLFVKNVPGARSMVLSPGGVLYVGTRNEGKVYAIRTRGDRKVITIASGLHSPNGVAFKDGSLYVAEISRVIRFDDIDNTLGNSPQYKIVSDAFPSDESHGWKFIKFGPDGKLYVPVGLPCNICEPDDKRYGTIMFMDPDGSNLSVFARGVRNTVGFDWQQGTNDLWFTDNGRDWLGDNLPPDELNVARSSGMNFGFPYCYGNNHPDPEFDGVDCSQYAPAVLELGPHVAALGMRFYTGSLFPEKYRGGIFIAEHGSWNRTTPIGYRVVFVHVQGNTPVSSEIFADGWLQNGIAWGRPVDVLVMPDGSLLVSDDKGDAIYRITYKG